MNREEAIKVLENPDVSIGVSARIGQDPEYWRKLRPALDMAISALRKQETVTNRNGLNEPLTLDELRQMDGEPVYCVEITGREEWLFRRDGGFADMYGEFTSDDFVVWDNYGKLWWCYRQKPEEDDHDERKENEHV